MLKTRWGGWVGLFAAALLAACGAGDGSGSGQAMAAASVDPADADIVVYKSPLCGCCEGWAEHMAAAGYTVARVDLQPAALSEKKVELGVPYDLGSCHTATLDGYVFEGHIPAETVRRFLEERPDVDGLAVRGMPIGSPGMEGPNPQPYDVIAFRGQDRTVYETVDPR